MNKRYLAEAYARCMRAAPTTNLSYADFKLILEEICTIQQEHKSIYK